MEPPRTALYTIIPTSEHCLSCRLYVGATIIWSNPVVPTQACEEHARARMFVWARQQSRASAWWIRSAWSSGSRSGKRSNQRRRAIS